MSATSNIMEIRTLQRNLKDMKEYLAKIISEINSQAEVKQQPVSQIQISEEQGLGEKLRAWLETWHFFGQKTPKKENEPPKNSLPAMRDFLEGMIELYELIIQETEAGMHLSAVQQINKLKKYLEDNKSCFRSYLQVLCVYYTEPHRKLLDLEKFLAAQLEKKRNFSTEEESCIQT